MRKTRKTITRLTQLIIYSFMTTTRVEINNGDSFFFQNVCQSTSEWSAESVFKQGIWNEIKASSDKCLIEDLTLVSQGHNLCKLKYISLEKVKLVYLQQ